MISSHVTVGFFFLKDIFWLLYVRLLMLTSFYYSRHSQRKLQSVFFMYLFFVQIWLGVCVFGYQYLGNILFQLFILLLVTSKSWSPAVLVFFQTSTGSCLYLSGLSSERNKWWANVFQRFPLKDTDRTESWLIAVKMDINTSFTRLSGGGAVCE